MADTVPEFVVVVLKRIAAGKTDEMHHEAATFDEALELSRHAHDHLDTWVAITIVNATEYPRFLQGAERTG